MLGGKKSSVEIPYDRWGVGREWKDRYCINELIKELTNELMNEGKNWCIPDWIDN